MSIQPLNNGGPPPSYSPPAKSPHGVEVSAPRDSSTAPTTSKLQVAQDSQKNSTQPPADQKESLRQATKRVNDLITGLSSDLKFTVDEETGTNVVKVVDVKTKEVIRQIPAQEMLEIAKRLDELQGLLIKEQV